LKSQDFNIGLSVTATSGYGPIELNTSNGEFAGGDGHPITLNGQVYPTGLGVHANSEIHIHATNLETPACTRFQADVGVDDEVGSNGSVVFQVFADGVKLFDSGVMTGASATQHIDVGIGNKSDLRFVVTDAGNNSFYDHADWAGARLDCTPAQAAPSLTLDQSSLNIFHLHSGTFKATFHNYPAGPVNIRTVGYLPRKLTDDPEPAMHLDTTTVILSGASEETKDITFTAKGNIGYADADKYFPVQLVTSMNSKDIDSIPIALKESPLKITFNNMAVAGRVGETKTVILTVNISPPVDFMPEIGLGLRFPRVGPFVITPGETTGNGSQVQIPITVQFPAPFPFDRVESVSYTLGLSGITSGYRDGMYSQEVNLRLSVLP